ncbi:MAG: MBL fold metallo-hydrolase [Oscillospiraceae bacterium]|nr:MBL fold metallo-hydrolase [Oscillospiraceae bacterium]
MKITWYGHSCFKIDCAEGTVVFDPYIPGKVPGLTLPPLEADLCISSHLHTDHYAPACVKLTGTEKAFALTSIATFHDDQQGALRGNNTITVLRSEGVSVAHLGDLGHMLSEQQLRELGEITVLLIPVGGFYTINAEQARQLVRDIAPRAVVPMHYRCGDQGLAPIAEVDDFLSLFDSNQIIHLTESSLEISSKMSAGVYVFPWPKR